MSKSTNTGPKVIIAGAGIAGPILAIFLKINGYSPVIYERQPKGSSGGIGLTLQPNGLRVLDLIPNLLSKTLSTSPVISTFQHFSTLPSDPGPLASTSVLAELYKSKDIKNPFQTTPRAKFHERIVEEAEEVYGVKIHYGNAVVDVIEEQEGEEVKIVLENGETDTASFVVGCDGLHSKVRIALFGKEKPDFTGMVQIGGQGPTPEDKTLTNGLTNIFGDGIHVITYPLSDTTIGWAITQNEAEERETWKPMDKAGQDAVRNGPYSQLPYGAGELIRNSPAIVKYGLYDRKELTTWYKGRVVLIGDAAHPTSPHLGQGANQAFEDVYHLIRLINIYNPHPSASPSSPPPALSTETLTKIFSHLTRLRQPRTSALVQGARAQGELRLVHGEETCKLRNDKVRLAWSDGGAVVEGYRKVWMGGFDDNEGEKGDDDVLKGMSSGVKVNT